MYKNILYDLDLPSEFPQHSELNGICLCVTRAYIVA